MSADIKGAEGLIRAFAGVSKQIEAANQQALTRIAARIQPIAKNYCPRSPTQEQRNSVRKTKRDTSKQKNPRATSRAKPGGLERSIESEVKPGEACIFVANNSEAGSYALKMHDERYQSWNKLGIGSIAKSAGNPVGEKFIERAINDNIDNIKAVFENEHRKVKL